MFLKAAELKSKEQSFSCLKAEFKQKSKNTFTFLCERLSCSTVGQIWIFFNKQQTVEVTKKCLYREKKRTHVCVEETPSCCALCQDVLKDPVSTSCGHWFCRQCISSYWDQSASSGHSSCPQCGERSRTRAGLQTASQSSSVQGKSEHLYI